MSEEQILIKLGDQDKRFDDHDLKFDNITKKLIDHDQKFEQLNKKFDDYHRENLDKQDKIITILERLDQERIFTNETIKRIQSDVERNTEENKKNAEAIQKLKFKLNIT